VLRHLLRVWFYLSPGLYSLAVLDRSATFRQHPLLQTVAHSNPVAILFEAYRAAIYGTPDGTPQMPDLMSLAALSLASLVLLGFAIIVFKRLEPSFAKVL
jgi:ABC-type polysaccharide/polyol phosphate export permease